MILSDPKTHDEWIAERRKGIGASEAAAVLGLNPWQSNVDLWKIKTGKKLPEDISEKECIRYGKQAEQHIRELFRLDFPQYSVDYHEFRMYADDENPFIFATLDGELTDRTNGTRGILEIKTTEILNSSQWTKWDGCIPQNYYVQVLHQLIATGFDFAVLTAQIKYSGHGDVCKTTRHYTIRKNDVLNELNYIITKEREFWECVLNDTEPALILPQI